MLLCNPLGEEATRAHRLYRVLASQLENAGYAVLRFDFHGTGDSSGEFADATIAGWQRDVTAAAQELQRLSGATRLVAVGLRLGGTLASLAGSSAGLRIRHLILWDPVVNGAVYLRELADSHRTYMKQELGETGWRDNLAIDVRGFPGEALGLRISPSFANEMAALDLTTSAPHADHVTVICTSDNPSMARFRDRLAGVPRVKWIDMPPGSDWNSDAAVNNTTVPMEIIQTMVARVQELNP